MVLRQPSPEEIACLRECLSLALGGNGSLVVASIRTVLHGREKARLMPFSLSPLSDVASASPSGTDSRLPSTGRDVCSQCPVEVHGGKPEREDAANGVLMEAGGIRASLHGRMKLRVPHRERWAPCRPLRRDEGWHEQCRGPWELCTCRGAGSCSQGKADIPLQSGGQQQRCFGAVGGMSQ